MHIIRIRLFVNDYYEHIHVHLYNAFDLLSSTVFVIVQCKIKI